MKTAKKFFLTCSLLLSFSLSAFVIEPNQKLLPCVTYSVSDPALEPIFLNAFTQWNTALDQRFTITAADASETPTISVVTVDSIPGGYVGWTFATGRRAVIQILRSAPPGVPYDPAIILLHELGHALGLGHSTDPQSVMWAVPTMRMLMSDDVSGVRSVYGLGPIDLSLQVTVTGRGHKRKLAANYPVLWNYGDGSGLYTLPVAYPVVHRFAARGWYAVTATYIGQSKSVLIRVK